MFRDCPDTLQDMNNVEVSGNEKGTSRVVCIFERKLKYSNYVEGNATSMHVKHRCCEPRLTNFKPKYLEEKPH